MGLREMHLGVKARRRNTSRRAIAAGLSTLAILSIGVVTVLVESAGASVTPPAAVDELVSLPSGA
jgi:hypothetical protein